MGDEEDLREREKELRKDKIDQAKWYESLNLYKEALKIFESLKDSENISRLRKKMSDEYSEKARELEAAGKYQEAVNLFFLIGDDGGVARIKKLKPDVVIIYDKESNSISKLAESIEAPEGKEVGDEHFRAPNAGDKLVIDEGEDPPVPDERRSQMVIEDGVVKGKEGLPVKMPKGIRPVRFCPYCGESLITKKEATFCPFCGEEL